MFWIVAGVVGLVVAIAFLVTAVVLVLSRHRGRVDAVGAARLGGRFDYRRCVYWNHGACVGFCDNVPIPCGSTKETDYEHFRARYRASCGRSFDDDSARLIAWRSQRSSLQVAWHGKRPGGETAQGCRERLRNKSSNKSAAKTKPPPPSNEAATAKRAIGR